ncbi:MULTISPECIES: lysis protein [Erwinia]|uniref:lysis protein n=1 Tax=Erwinia TaxID=551 RepID=UPI00105EDBF8|nr:MULTISPECIES: lysis protein [Erwinia]NNS05809.1 lysis protein [Erwinia sp. JH02]TDS98316.1 prophage endopeptidase [Erwinia rhapontici]
MTFDWRTMVWGLLLVIAIASAKLASYYHGQAIAADGRTTTAETLAKQRQETITDMQTRQRDVAALDAKYTKELTDAKAENDALQRKLDRGGRVLVAGNCPKQTTGTASVDNGTTVELSDIAGRNVLGIRAGIKNDQSKIAALQQYITEQCIK